MITLNLNSIEDEAVKAAFKQLLDQLNSKELLSGEWDYIEYTFPTCSGTVFQLNHRLKFKPVDIIELHRDSALTVTYTKNLFTQTTVYLTATGSGVLRILVGKQKRG